MYEFMISPMTKDWKLVTINRIVQTEYKWYEYDELIEIVDHAIRTERSIYGWFVYYTENNQNYELYLRSRIPKYNDETTRKKQSIKEWIDYITERNQQLELF